MAFWNTGTLPERLPQRARARAYAEDLSPRSSVPFLHLRLENKDKEGERSPEQSSNGGTPLCPASEVPQFCCANVSRETMTRDRRRFKSRQGWRSLRQ